MNPLRRKILKTGLLLSPALAVADAFWLEEHFFETSELYLGKASPELGHELKILQLSDLHLREINDVLQRVATLAHESNPDLILLTGDAIDDAKNLSLLQRFLNMLPAHAHKIAIPGNWEYWGRTDMQELHRVYASRNTRLLINESVQLNIRGRRINLTGTDDLLGGNADISKALSTFIPGDFHIVLNHCPAYAEEIAAAATGPFAYDLLLSGHTHGGQVRFGPWAPFKPPGSGRFLSGWYEDLKMYVSRGLGTSVLPVRFMARAEISLFYLKK